MFLFLTFVSGTLRKALEGGYEGIDNFTDKQKIALMGLIKSRKAIYRNAAVAGHSHFDDKECPSFDVVAWYEGNIVWLS